MKVIFISDIHLRDYQRFNKFPQQRLNSFIELAKDIVKIGKDQGVTNLICGGDLIDKTTISPSEVHVLFKMFSILATQFDVYSIVGNHDAKSKKDISTNDTLVTLLELIPKVKFIHRDIIHLGGRSIAMENWCSEPNLDWLPIKPDIYVSHVAIDYDNTGLYGIDTSIYEDKFTLGLFGDIHVTRQLGNLVSIGNTKQESLNDKFQGGVLVLDLDTLEYERIPIDENNVKYLKLVPTDIEEDEGWESESNMIYKIYRPSRSSKSSHEFHIPDVSNILEKTESIMIENNLMDIHSEVSKEATYEPIDFNFQLVNLRVKNFRSITDYNLDFSNDYVITGHNGSGKSTLILGLFFSMIGKKTLGKEVTFGETSCVLELTLIYQNLKYVITRGTSTGEYGLKIGDSDPEKYNSKLEFERDVFARLPFLEFHESFFFNYWDTELLGSMKVDRRFDLLAKYYRLDTLNDYYDVAKKLYTQDKGSLTTSSKELDISESKLNSELDRLNSMREFLSDKPSLDIITRSLESNKTRLSVEDEIKGFKSQLDVANLKLTSLEQEQLIRRNIVSELRAEVSKLESKDSLIRKSENYKSRLNLEDRISKGKVYVDSLETKLLEIKHSRELIESRLNSIGPVEEPKDPLLTKRILEMEDALTSHKNRVTQSYYQGKQEVTKYTDEVNRIEVKIQELKSSGDTVCNSCGSVVKVESLISGLLAELESNKKSLSEVTEKFKAIELEYSNFDEDHKVEYLELATLKELNSDFHRALNIYRNNQEEISNLKSQSVSISTQYNDALKNCTEGSSLLEELKSELTRLPTYSLDEYTKFRSEIDTYDRFEVASRELDTSEITYQDNKSQLDRLIQELKLLIAEKEFSLPTFTSLNESEVLDYMKWKLMHEGVEDTSKEVEDLKLDYSAKLDIVTSLTGRLERLTLYMELTSRSGIILKSILDELTKSFSSNQFRFSTYKTQASGKIVTDLSISYLVGSKWVPYESLSSGQKTLCDLYYISKVVTGVGVISFDETLRFLDDENLIVASEIINSMRRNNLLISSHAINLQLDGATTLYCSLDDKSRTKITKLD